MKISFWSIGSRHEPYVRAGIEEFTARIARYFPVEWKLLALPKSMTGLAPSIAIAKEAELVTSTIKKEDYLIALDERGKLMDSPKLAGMLQERANASTRHVIFLIGGAYGLDDSLRRQCDLLWSLSPLTFPHQLVRLILAEQVYRACTILRNEQYHH